MTREQAIEAIGRALLRRHNQPEDNWIGKQDYASDLLAALEALHLWEPTVL
jgi:hypothetical protein